MPIAIASFLLPRPGGNYFLLEDVYLRGGFRVVATHEARDAIPPLSRKAQMLVVTQDDKKIWQMDDDLETWSEFKAGGGGDGAGPRATFEHTVNDIPALSYADFDMDAGNTIIVLKLRVSAACIVEVHETSQRIDNNPYKFIATEDHLEDDGTTELEDGTTVKNRRYSILTNMEVEPNGKQFIRIINPSESMVSVKLTVIYKPVEA